MFDFLLVDLPARSLALLGAISFIAAMARGFSGFGAALIFVPLASTIVSPKTAAPLLLIVDAVLALGFIPNAWRNANRPEVGVMALGSLSGIRSARSRCCVSTRWSSAGPSSRWPR